MNLTSIKIFLCRNDVKLIVISTVTGGILQVVSKQYLKRHPELLNDTPVAKKKSKLLKFLLPRGGALVEISMVSFKVVLNFLAQKGIMAGLLGGSAIVIGKLPVTAISTYLCDAFPQNLPDLEKKKFILVAGDKIYLDQCSQNLQYLFKVLDDPNIPYKKKEELARKIFTKYLNLKTSFGRSNFALCLIFIFYILSIQSASSFHIMISNLIRAIREGQISKSMGRLIVRRLKKKGIPVDPELIDVIAS